MKKALVVDDTKNIRNLLTTCLELNQYEVATAANGIEALKLFESENFDMAFLDIKMPEVSGTEVLRRVRSQGINTPVVIMTAFATVKNAVECTKLGAVAYLQKPFTADKVKSLLMEFEKSGEEPQNVLSCISMGKELLLENKFDEAYLYLKNALAQDPLNGELYYLIGKVYESMKDEHTADKFYRMARDFGCRW